MHHGVKAGGDSLKAKSDICCPDTYYVINNLCRLCREVSCILVIIISSFSSVCIAKPEEEGTSCGWSPGLCFSLFPRGSCSTHSLLGSEMPGACHTLSCCMGQLVNEELVDIETHSQGTRHPPFRSWPLISDARTASHRYLEGETGLLKYATRDILASL